ncbi:Cytochrome P450 [Amycolatopsis pretoriensis]|uniref:Cytochrome P450 n=1 Tax=Amycolatopsis pretoriensis TaxID=218821 RepID=A0A1H5QK47_9PSEU|nr:cytochrome P450 [Amycolatopsis pretoriensis]SEF26533.1 Cytochrome P450 [Amycolatopsis pretoriensis]
MTTEPPQFPFHRECPFTEPHIYTESRAEQPVRGIRMVDGRPAWLLTRYEDVRAVLNDRRFSSDKSAPDYPVFVVGQKEGLDKSERFMVNMDGEEHAAARRAVISEFSTRRIAALTPHIQQSVDTAVDNLLASPRPADLIRSVAMPVPSMLTARLVGIDHTDYDRFQNLTSRSVRHDISAEERVRFAEELREYMDSLVAAKVEHPGDDLLSRQIAQQRRERGEVDVAGLSSLAVLLMIAGQETTTDTIALGVLALLSEPDQLAELAADPGKVPLAVEEILRYFSVLDFGPPRLATADVEVGGVLVRAGEGVVANVYAANRDSSVFTDPGALNVNRANARSHLAFGYGPHQCLGANLVRHELRIVFETLIRRVPGLRLAVDFGELKFKNKGLIYGVHELPVTW